MDNYLVHSAKGTSWGDHKYYKKVNGVYFYSKESYDKFMATSGTQSDSAKAAAAAQGKKLYSVNTDSTKTSSTATAKKTTTTAKTQSTSSTSSKKSSSKKSSGSSVKSSSKSTGKSSKSSSSSSKSTKSSTDKQTSSGSSSSSSKSTGEKTTKSTTAKETTQKTTTEKATLVDYRTGIKNTLKSAMDLKDDDSVYAKVNDDNQWEVIVETASGKSTKYILDSDYKVVSKEDTSEEKEEDK